MKKHCDCFDYHILPIFFPVFLMILSLCGDKNEIKRIKDPFWWVPLRKTLPKWDIMKQKICFVLSGHNNRHGEYTRSGITFPRNKSNKPNVWRLMDIERQQIQSINVNDFIRVDELMKHIESYWSGIF